MTSERKWKERMRINENEREEAANNAKNPLLFMLSKRLSSVTRSGFACKRTCGIESILNSRANFFQISLNEQCSVIKLPLVFICSYFQHLTVNEWWELKNSRKFCFNTVIYSFRQITVTLKIYHLKIRLIPNMFFYDFGDHLKNNMFPNTILESINVWAGHTLNDIFC